MNEKNKTILIIDDDEMITEIGCKLLSDAGYNVFFSNSAKHGIELFNNNRIDAVIIDFMLPDGNGIDIYLELIKLNKCIKVLFISGLMNKKKLNEILQYKNTDFIQKPFSLNEMLIKIEHIINVR